MVEASRSLWVAAAAASLLLVVVAVDASVNRTLELQVDGPSEGRDWQTFSSSGEDRYRFDRGDVVVEANRTETLTFRLHIDNELPWDYDEDYRLRAGSTLLGSGSLKAPGGGTGTAEVQTTAGELIDANQGPRKSPSPASVHLEASMGSQTLFGFLTIEEVPR